VDPVRTSLVTFGEAMLRLSMTADSFKPYVGGSELNVAVLAARLGVQTRWVSRLPDNALGKMIAARAAEQGVDTQVEWTPEGRVGLYFLESGAAVHISNVLYDRAGRRSARSPQARSIGPGCSRTRAGTTSAESRRR
jgi:2-dehydro-3-deoxygluconokinase